jgi:hypothetical protein
MVVVGGILLAVAVFTIKNKSDTDKRPAPLIPVHVDNSFQFLVHAPISAAAPLFGPEGERVWAGDEWDPQFLHPHPGKDQQGMVFTVQQGKHTSTWVATVFDLAGGRMQYVSVVPGIRISFVDVQLTARDASTTSVEVRYVRTALDVSANDEVQALGESDRHEGPHWQEAIESYLRGQRDRKH